MRKIQWNKKFRHIECIDLIVCGLLGLFAFLFLYGADSLHVTFDQWILNGYIEEDIIQHYTGWMAFRDSAWSFPLGLAGNLGAPDGVIISFTDSIPLVSLFFKLISPILPETFQFFGLYILLCYMLQGIAAGMLTGLFTRKRWAIYSSSALFVFAPILMERAFRHTALASHWLILFALYLYFKANQENDRYQWGFLLINGLAIGIHPYFIPMTVGILAAHLLEAAIHRREIRRPVLIFLENIAVILLVGFAIGIFGSGVSGEAGGFGYFSMNLNALWNPLSLGIDTWSATLPVQAQTLGNYEGFNYLGLGILVLGIPAGICGIFRLTKEKMWNIFIRKYLGMLLFAVVCCLFAISNVWTFNDQILCTIPLPEKLLDICSVFRASGRMFYPVYYLIFLGVCVFLSRLRKTWMALAGLGILLAVQLCDLSPAIAQKQSSIDAAHLEPGSLDLSLYSSEDWQYLFDHYDSVELLTYHHDYNLAAFLMKHHMISNILPANRGDFERAEALCEENVRRLYAGERMEEDTVYITNDRILANELCWNLNAEMKAFELGEYVAFGVEKEEDSVPEPEITLLENTYCTIERDSGDWNYLKEAKENELVLAYTPAREQALANATGIICDGREVQILGYQVYQNEYIRDYIYVQCEEGVDLDEFKCPGVIEFK